MNWSELIQVTAERAGVTPTEARKVLEAMRDVAGERLAQDDRVVLFGIGTLSTRTRKARVIRNIGDYRKMFLGEGRQIVFRPAAALKRRVATDDSAWKSPEHQAAWRLAEALVGDLELYHEAQIPSALSGTDAQVRAACKASFGEPWDRVEESYAAQVAQSVGAEHDYLAGAARGRWG